MLTEIELRGVSERDIDLFLLEEVVASEPFRSWFLSQIEITTNSQLIRAARSVITSTGESDVEFTLRNEEGLTRVLVENKVDAVLQDRQPERYTERAEAYVASGECDYARTVLFAPEGYSASDLGFDYCVSYEAVRAQLDAGTDGDPRRAYKLALIEAAIDRGLYGWTLIPDQAATDLWNGYWERAVALVPQLRMPKPDKKPATAGFIRFRPPELPARVRLLHKLPHGNVDLEFSGLADRISEFASLYSNLLDDDMSIVQASKSLAVRIGVPVIRTEIPIENSEADVENGLLAAARLLEWYIRHRPDISA